MNNKRKGAQGERELLRILREAGFSAHRNDQRYVGGFENPDISLDIDGDVFHVEVKRKEHLNIHGAIEQAVNDANGKSFPIVAHRRNNEPWLITFRLQDGLDLVRLHRSNGEKTVERM